MKRLALVLAGFAATPAIAGPETDFPHRDWGRVVTLDMTLGNATACIAREMDKGGSVLVLPNEGGNDIDYTPPGPLFMPSTGDPWLRIKVRPEGETSSMRIFYRHPVGDKWIGREYRRLQRRCLVVKAVEPPIPD